MVRELTVAAAQMGPVQRDHDRDSVVERLITMLVTAADRGAQLVAFPELALTTFFPRWHVADRSEVDHYYETEMPNRHTKPLWDEARRLGVGFSLGYALLTDDGHRFNVSHLVGPDGDTVGVFRKVHIPGHDAYEPHRPFQHAERWYFEPGDDFPAFRAFGGIVGMAICNDRRWPETYRELALQGTELVLIGYNTPIHYPPDPGQDRLQGFHNQLVMQSGAYQNGLYVVGVAKGGVEEGVESLAESAIIAPSGEILARAETDGDEVIVATLDLDLTNNYKHTLFDLDRYRMPGAYRRIAAGQGVTPPPEEYP